MFAPVHLSTNADTIGARRLAALTMHTCATDHRQPHPLDTAKGTQMSNENDRSEHSPLSPDVADKLLELLSTDDEFRSLFHADPAAALAKAGHPTAGEYADRATVTEGDTFYCMTANELASKDEIRKTRDQLQTFLTSQNNHRVIFCFEAGKIASTLRAT